MPFEVFADAHALAARGAALLAETVRAAVHARGRCVLAASGGKTPWAMYAALAREDLPWERVHVVQVDERVAPAGHPDRNLDGLMASLGAAAARATVHPMPVEASDLEAAALDYQRELAAITGGAPAVLDVADLGLGADGHTASLVPGDAVLDATSDVALTAPYAGWRRMTLTRPALGRARRVLWVVAGAEKAPAVERLLAMDGTIPAGRILPERATLLVDRAAAGLLSPAS